MQHIADILARCAELISHEAPPPEPEPPHEWLDTEPLIYSVDVELGDA